MPLETKNFFQISQHPFVITPKGGTYKIIVNVIFLNAISNLPEKNS